jgi:membrane protein DedA with SNARE-associated domain
METANLIALIEVLYLSWGYLIVFLATLIETSPLGFTIPGGLIIALGGFYSFGNPKSLVVVVIAGSLGMLSTFWSSYFLGKKTGYRIALYLHQEKNVNRAKILLEKHGPVILTTSLLASITRFWVAYVAGIQKYNFALFSFYALVASLSWNSLFVMIGYLAGSERQNLEKGLAQLGILAWGIVIIAVLIIYLLAKKEFPQKNV